MSRSSFFRAFLTSPRTTGSVTPSSRYLTRKMTAAIDFSRSRCIVELGSGTGCVTRALLQHMRPDAKLLAFETNPHFVGMLEGIGDPRLQVIADSAEHISKHLDEGELADYIVSGLPLAILPEPVTNAILDDARNCLSRQGRYIQFQYSLVSRKSLLRRFPSMRIAFTPWNVPPAFVYICGC